MIRVYYVHLWFSCYWYFVKTNADENIFIWGEKNQPSFSHNSNLTNTVICSFVHLFACVHNKNLSTNQPYYSSEASLIITNCNLLSPIITNHHNWWQLMMIDSCLLSINDYQLSSIVTYASFKHYLLVVNFFVCVWFSILIVDYAN